jgi:hypothetical protein
MPSRGTSASFVGTCLSALALGCASGTTAVSGVVPVDTSADDDAIAIAESSSDSTIAPPVIIGEVTPGELVEIDSFPEGATYVGWYFDVDEGRELILSVDGERPRWLETALLVYRATAEGRPRGEALAAYDDEAPGAVYSNWSIGSRVEMVAPETGRYVALIRWETRQDDRELGVNLTLAVRPIEGEPPIECGLPFGTVCPEGEYCDFLGTDCGSNAYPGECRPRPRATDCAPWSSIDRDVVCGCDGATWTNACLAAAEGVDTASAIGTVCDDYAPPPP